MYYHISFICVVFVASLLGVASGFNPLFLHGVPSGNFGKFGLGLHNSATSGCRTSLGELAPVRHKEEVVTYNIQNDFSILIRKVGEYNIGNPWMEEVKTAMEMMMKDTKMMAGKWLYELYPRYSELDHVIIHANKIDTNTIKVNVGLLQVIQDIPQLGTESRECWCPTVDIFGGCIGGTKCDTHCSNRDLNGDEVNVIKQRLIDKSNEIYKSMPVLN